jgi:hypothetical protein
MEEEPKQTKCYCGHTTYCDCGPEEIIEPNEALKLAKKRHSDDLFGQWFGPEGAYEDISDWDATLMDGLEYESWDEIYDDYVGEADLHEFIQWLKDNFQIPNKLGSQNF